VIETEKPNPFLLDLLAGHFALVQAPEAVDAFASSWQNARPDQVVGSGPFMLESNAEGTLTFSAFSQGHNPPLLDHIELHQPGGDVTLFEANKLDEVLTRDRRDAPSVRSAAPGSRELARYEDSPVISTFFVGAPPWNNIGLLQAISAALNRSHLADLLFGGRAAACGPVSPATPAFALSEAALAAYPGYRLVADADAADARARWSAAGGTALGPILIDIPSIFDPLYTVGAQVTGRLNDVLGPQFRWSVETYTTISKKAAAAQYGNGKAAFWLGWAPPLSGPDPSLAFIDSFDSRAPGARQFGVASGGFEAQFDALSAEFSIDSRTQKVRDISGAILASGGTGVVSWLLQRSELFRRNGLDGPAPTPFWSQHLDARRYFA
jgi:ABC-type transport system substrate-binding protein